MVNYLEKNNILTVVKDGLCVGCGTCVALCPKEAIKIVINKDKGLYIPKINENNCYNCKECLKVCPGHEVNFIEFYRDLFKVYPNGSSIGHYSDCYVGGSTNNKIKYKCSSGGIFTTLLIFALEEGIVDGVLLTKMKNDNPLEPEPFIARTKEEILEASQDKYCPVPPNIMVKEILNSKEEEKFAVVGLPCHIHGIRKLEKINPKIKEKIVLKLGLFCSYGVNYLATEYLLKKINIPIKKIKKINYREGTFPPGFTLIAYDTKIEKIKHMDLWQLIFSFPFWFSPFRCMLCADQTSELADISIGSGWFSFKEYGNKNQSVIITRNQFSENILKECELKGNIEIIRLPPENLVKLEEMQEYKKKKLKTNIQIFKFLRKRVPKYKTTGFYKPNYNNYLIGIFTYLQTYFSNKRYLWGLLSIIQSFKNKLICNKLFIIFK